MLYRILLTKIAVRTANTKRHGGMRNLMMAGRTVTGQRNNFGCRCRLPGGRRIGNPVESSCRNPYTQQYCDPLYGFCEERNPQRFEWYRTSCEDRAGIL